MLLHFLGSHHSGVEVIQHGETGAELCMVYLDVAQHACIKFLTMTFTRCMSNSCESCHMPHRELITFSSPNHIGGLIQMHQVC